MSWTMLSWARHPLDLLREAANEEGSATHNRILATTNGAEPGITFGMTDQPAAQGDVGRNKNFRPRQPHGKKLAASMSGNARHQTGTKCGV